MKSLADHLGVKDLNDPNKPVAPARRMSIKQFCQGIIESPDYRAALMAQILLGELPPAVHVLLYHYGYGKPVEHVKIEDVTGALENQSVEQLEHRALVLAATARQLREQQQPADNEDPPNDSVH